MAAASVEERLKVFISYSRRDSAAFVDELVAGLEVAGFAPFLDRHDIAAGEDWEERLGGLIAESDTVVFVVSPEAVKSERCIWEVNRTIELSKRLLPVIFKLVAEHDIPKKLSRLQFIRFDSGPGFARPLSQLATALRVDLDWIREHTRLGGLSTRWNARGRPESLLLRSDELDAVKAWIATRKPAAPEIAETVNLFIRASEESEATRLGKERAQLEVIRGAQEATSRQQRRAARLLWGVAALVAMMIGYVTWQGYDVAWREINVFTARAADALNNEQFDRAMRYALQAYPARDSFPWTTPFSTELEGKLAGGAQSTRLYRLLKGHSALVRYAVFSPDGKRVVTASADNTARLWDVDSGKEIASLKGHARGLSSVAFSPDGKRVVTSSWDKTARLWDTDSGKEIAGLKGHEGLVSSAAFSPDGKRVVTASWDNTARLWDVDSGKEIASLKGHEGLVSSAVFSPDGKRVVTASADNTARLWALGSAYAEPI
jgi:WD40 repeat protein